MMWRYYELLTDVRTDRIEQMKQDAASGKAHPMALKKELAMSIVADFHSPEAAAKAAEDWAKQFQKDEVPEGLDVVAVQSGLVGATEVQASRVQPDTGDLRPGYGSSKGPTDIHFLKHGTYSDLFFVIRTDKLLAESGLAASAADGTRKIKQKAVRINQEAVEKFKLALPRIPCELMVKAGRLMKRVEIV